MKVGDIIIALPEANMAYSITRGKDFEGKIVNKRSLNESKKRGRKGNTIRVKVIKSEEIGRVGEYYWVDEKYFELKNVLEKLEEF